jgi:ABC-2 type transport system permease protein
MTALIAAEWLKLRTTRLLVATLPIAAVLSVAAVTGMALSGHSDEAATAEGAQRILSVAGAGAIVLLIVGILISAGEHRHGTVTDTYLTTPQRQRVLTAKFLVAGSLGVVSGFTTAAACVLAAYGITEGRGSALLLDSGGVWLTLPGTAVYTGLFAVLGAAIGAIARNQVVAIAITLGWIAIVEHTLVNLIPTAGRWLPVGAGQAILRTPIDGLLSPPAAVAVLTAYTALAATAGVMIERSRGA